MNSKKLPVKLGKDPLIDAVFEMRFKTDVNFSDVLPGIFFKDLPGEKTITQLPAHDVPAKVRKGDPNFQHAALTRVQLEKYSVAIGESNIVVGCNMPYQGWSAFKPIIKDVLSSVEQSGVKAFVERFSMKYIDLLEGNTLAGRAELLDASFSIGEYALKDRVFSLRVEVPSDPYLNIIGIFSSGHVMNNAGEKKSGAIIETDTIKNAEVETTLAEFMADNDTFLDDLHLENKRMFFNSITEKAIQTMEPVYE